MIAREPDVWDDVWNALLLLDRDHHDRLRAILERCCDLSTEYISGQGGLFQVLTADEMLDSDVAAARDDRRVAEGFISPADARAFLAFARQGRGGDERDPITRAYFRGLEQTKAPASRRASEARRGRCGAGRGGALASPADVRDLAALLREAEVIAPATVQPLAALAAGDSGDSTERQEAHVVAPLFEQAMRDLRQRDPEQFDARVREVGYLVNVWIAGGAHEGRRPRPTEAMEVVLKTCEAGLRAQLAAGRGTADEAVAVLARTPADVLFRRASATSDL